MAKAVIAALRDEGFGVVAPAVETPFVAVARDANKRVLAGDRVLVLQGVEQFVLYTGMRPDAEQTAAAARAAAG